jgi:hypothetical protein
MEIAATIIASFTYGVATSFLVPFVAHLQVLLKDQPLPLNPLLLGESLEPIKKTTKKEEKFVVKKSFCDIISNFYFVRFLLSQNHQTNIPNEIQNRTIKTSVPMKGKWMRDNRNTAPDKDCNHSGFPYIPGMYSPT